MEWKAAVTANAANTTADNKLNILGIFEEIYTSAVPCQIPLVLVMLLRVEPMDKGRSHSIEIHIIDEDGKLVTKIEGAQIFVFDQTVYLSGPAHVILNMPAFQFVKFGAHTFEVYVEGKYMGNTVVNVRPMALPAEQGTKQ